MLELVSVKYSYTPKNRNVKPALEQLTMKFEVGTFYTIFGPSGSGKTTCLSLLGGLDKPTEGKVKIDGKEIGEIGSNIYRRKYISYVFQDFHLFSYMTAVENVWTAIKIVHPSWKKADIIKKARDTLQALGLSEQEMGRKVTKLSGGQMQRVAIARALAVETPYILADEPTGNLDAENTEIIISLLRELVEKYNKCVIVVTHSLKVRDASDISYVIEDGKLSETVILRK